jgi:hypothetical protein
MEIEIRNADLIPSAVPDTPYDRARFEAFALSFDGYAHWGARCAQLAEAAAVAFHDHGIVPSGLSDLRACLFYEHQRLHWQPTAASDANHRYAQALLDAIRDAATSTTASRGKGITAGGGS